MAATELTPQNIQRIAWLNGFRGVADLARSIGRSRPVVYAALARPQQYKPTVRALEQALPKR